MQPAAVRRRRSSASLLVAMLVASLLLAPASGATAQGTPEPNRDVVAISFTLTLDQVLDEGRFWIDGDGLHIRGLTTEYVVEGDLTGGARLTTLVDWAGPCDAAELACEGDQESFSTIEITSDAGNWSGTLAIEIFPDSAITAHGVLIGRHGASDRVIVIDELAGADADGLAFAGQMVTLTGPIGGVHLTQSACVTGERTADGGFLGSGGLVNDSGPARVRFEPVGFPSALGVYGEIAQIGHKGVLRGIFVATANNQHAYGNFVIAGTSGAYDSMLGYGRATFSLVDEPRCASGVQLVSSWTGQVRFLSDPAKFLPPRVFFISPLDGATVSTPVTLELGAEHVTIEPAGEARDGAGYLNVIVDAPCIGPGKVIPEDDQHIRLTDGETILQLSLMSGQHRLCLQLSDGHGVAQPATHVIRILVSTSNAGGPDF